MNKKTIVIPYEIKSADSFFSRLKGLMLRKEPIMNEGLWIVPCNAVHMFFMKFPIDVVLLNEQKEVVGLYADLQPWKITKPLKTAYSTLELPAGTINRLEIDLGSSIQFTL
ncbi:DUF192 domain-containing protein [Neobacillus dielmonensis]|uniref:DUF192 domain-containing protein n=1 Tax=Neobacillus dielmonensis TaxID=1347369 RepID=UPI0005AAD822|nr:DUF192 domain-containing protein [Neobacillus dielmonensis]